MCKATRLFLSADENIQTSKYQFLDFTWNKNQTTIQLWMAHLQFIAVSFIFLNISLRILSVTGLPSLLLLLYEGGHAENEQDCVNR